MFFDEDHARAAVVRLVQDGFEARAERERFAGEDDDQDHPWVVVTDAPEVVLEPLVNQYDGWSERDAPPLPTTPLDLPQSPRRLKRDL